jgi:hypothetical protein
MSTEQKKLNQQEFDRLQKIRQASVEVASTLGELSYQKISLDLQIENQKEKIKNIKEEETSFFDDLREKYGNVVLNIDTGEIN